MAYLFNVPSPSDVANWVRQQNIPRVPAGFLPGGYTSTGKTTTGATAPTNALGFLAGRPNQALERGIYNVLPLRPTTHLSYMGQEATVNMKELLGGVALLAVGLFLLGSKTADRTRGRRRERLRRRLAALEA